MQLKRQSRKRVKKRGRDHKKQLQNRQVKLRVEALREANHLNQVEVGAIAVLAVLIVNSLLKAVKKTKVQNKLIKSLRVATPLRGTKKRIR